VRKAAPGAATAVLSIPPLTVPAADRGFDAASPPAPRLERGACPIEVEPGERIDCGVPLVPENRGKPDRRTIRPPVMVFRSRSTSPAPDPLVFVTGGP
jgi:hypothetical protein